MKLSICTQELTKEKGTFLAIINWFKYDGGQVGTPRDIKYGSSEEQAYNNLKELLEERGHTIVE